MFFLYQGNGLHQGFVMRVGLYAAEFKPGFSLQRFHDLIVDAYGEPGENYPISMENRYDRMPRITVRDVLDKIERWRSTYASASSAPKL